MNSVTQGVLHLHIPKTAGTALREHFVTQLGESNVTPRLSGIGLREALLRYQTTQVITGHLLATPGDRLPTDRVTTVVLRHPVDRVLSQFFYTKQQNPNPFLDMRFKAMDLDAYLNSLEAGAENELFLQRDMLYPLAISFDAYPTEDEKLAAALLALDAFQFVGIQDELDDFTAMLDAHFGWPDIPLERHNITAQRQQIDELDGSQLRHLKTLLEPEIELYANACSRFRRERRRFIRVKHEQPSHVVPAPVVHPPRKSFDLRRLLRMPPSPRSVPASPQPATFAPSSPPLREPASFGSHACTIDLVEVDGREPGSACLMQGESMIVRIRFTAHRSIEKILVGIGIRDDKGLAMFGTNSRMLGHTHALLPGQYTASFTMLNRLPTGSYRLDVALVRDEQRQLPGDCYHWIDQVALFDVVDSLTVHSTGPVLMDADFKLEGISQKVVPNVLPVEWPSKHLRVFARSNPPLTAFAASVSLLQPLDKLPAGMDVIVALRVQNQGDAPWPAAGWERSVTMSYRWLGPGGRILVADGLRSLLPCDLAPQGVATLSLRVRVPQHNGELTLLISPVQESVAWFVEQQPESGLAVPVRIEKP